MFNIVLEKRYVLIEMHIVLFIIAAQIHFIIIQYSSANKWYSTQLKMVIQALPQSEKLREILNTPNFELPRI